MSERGTGLGVVALALLAALSLLFAGQYLEHERPNQDEGWYLMAARLVGEGQRPYVDFAYVQPPLLPYAYALFGADRSVWFGRAVTAGFGLLALLFAALAARRGGESAMLVTGALLAFTPFALSQQSVVKAYALANACAALGLWLAGDGTQRRRVAPAAVAFALCALARNACAPILLAFWLWLAVAPERRRCLLLGLLASIAAVLAGYLPFILADAEAVRFHVFEHHARNAAALDPFELLVAMAAVGRLMVAACPALSIALLAGLMGLVWMRGEPARCGAEMLLAGLAAVLLGVGQFVSMHPYQEYQAVTLPPAALLAGLAWGELRRRSREPELTGAVLVALVGLFPLLALGPAVAGLSGSARGGVHGPRRAVAELVGRHCPPEGTLFTFQTDIAIEAHRRLSPGLTLASFSFTDLPDAPRRHLVSPESTTDTLAAAEPDVVVLSPGDLSNLLRGAWTADDRIVPSGAGIERYGPLVEALDRNYRLVGRVDQVGQFGETLSVLARREPVP